MNDISKACEIFDLISYADDTTLSSQIHCFGDASDNDNIAKNISSELNKISEWLKINKLSLNIKKTTFMIFHTPQKKYFYQLHFYANHEVHNHYTRQQQNLNICVVKHTFAKKCIIYSIPNLINETSSNIIDKVYTHCVNGFKQYVKDV